MIGPPQLPIDEARIDAHPARTGVRRALCGCISAHPGLPHQKRNGKLVFGFWRCGFNAVCAGMAL